MSGFAGTGLEGSKTMPQTKVFGHHWERNPQPVTGLNPANPPPANRTLRTPHRVTLTKFKFTDSFSQFGSVQSEHAVLFRMMLIEM